MPRSKNPDQDRWEIVGPRKLVGKDGETRRMVDVYKASKGITQPQAVAELIKAGYAHLVSIPLPPKVDGPNPHGATDGSNLLDKTDNR
jgi:hypothetical protein